MVVKNTRHVFNETLSKHISHILSDLRTYYIFNVYLSWLKILGHNLPNKSLQADALQQSSSNFSTQIIFSQIVIIDPFVPLISFIESRYNLPCMLVVVIGSEKLASTQFL